MQFLYDHESIANWLQHYGSFALFGLLAAGIILLPIPEETLMVISGILIKQGHVSPVGTVLAAYLGSMTGITVSYFIGRWVGKHLVIKYGSWAGLTEEKLQIAHQWFEKYGKWTLFFGYFVPGVRHFTGFTAGMAYLDFFNFAFFAYLGAFLWVSTFLSIGYFFGGYWEKIFEYTEIRLDQIVLVAAVGALIFIGRKYYKSKSR